MLVVHQKVIVVDMDGVICPESHDLYGKVLLGPLHGIKDLMIQWKDKGHVIIIHTARGWREFETTKFWLLKHGIPFDTLICGKPYADILIDDRSVKTIEEADAILASKDVKP